MSAAKPAPLKGKRGRGEPVAAPGTKQVWLKRKGAEDEHLYDTLGSPKAGMWLRHGEHQYTIVAVTEDRVTCEERADDKYANESLKMVRRFAAEKPTKEESEPGAPTAPRVKPSKVVDVRPEMLTAVKGMSGGACEKIREVATMFPDASVAEIRCALPDLNPSTVSIQVKKARAG